MKCQLRSAGTPARREDRVIAAALVGIGAHDPAVSRARRKRDGQVQIVEQMTADERAVDLAGAPLRMRI